MSYSIIDLELYNMNQTEKGNKRINISNNYRIILSLLQSGTHWQKRLKKI